MSRLVLPERIQHGATWLLAGYRLELEQRRLGLLLQWGVQRSNWCHKSRSLLGTPLGLINCSRLDPTHHSRAGENIPAQPHSVTVLYLAPLLLESFVIHHVGRPLPWRATLGRSRSVVENRTSGSEWPTAIVSCACGNWRLVGRRYVEIVDVRGRWSVKVHVLRDLRGWLLTARHLPRAPPTQPISSIR